MTSNIKPVSPVKWPLAKWLLIGVAALAVSGCKTGDQPSAALPPVAEGAALTAAPTADALPPAPAVPVSEVSDPEGTYAFPDRAYEMSDMFADAPPDYVYEYGDVQPWVWISDDGSECVVEAVPGGERYYYYEAGADEPFFVQDPAYGYGFEGGRLVAVYDRSGHALPFGDIRSRAGIAGRYVMRARSLYDASRQNRHEPVAESNWMTRRAMIAGQRQTWQRQMTEDTNWRAFHAQNAPAVEAHWRSEHVQRLKWAAHVDETMHNQTYAARERQEAQAAAAQAPPARPQPSSPPGRFAGSSQRPPAMERAAVPPQGPHVGPPQSRQAPPQERFAQRPGPQPPQAQNRQMPPPENSARQETPRGRQPSPPERQALARHEAPPAPQQAMAPPQDRMAHTRHEAPPPAPEQRNAARHEAPPAPAPQQRMTPPQDRMAQMRHGAPPPATPSPHMAMVPRPEHARPEAPPSPPPQAHAAAASPPPPHAAPPAHQQAAAAPGAHPAPAPTKDDKHKHG